MNGAQITVNRAQITEHKVKPVLCALLTVNCLLAACTSYVSPPRESWNSYLAGASLTDMTADAMVAKRPVYLGAGGEIVNIQQSTVNSQYNDPNAFVREHPINT